MRVDIYFNASTLVDEVIHYDVIVIDEWQVTLMKYSWDTSGDGGTVGFVYKVEDLQLIEIEGILEQTIIGKVLK